MLEMTYNKKIAKMHEKCSYSEVHSFFFQTYEFEIGLDFHVLKELHCQTESLYYLNRSVSILFDNQEP